MKLVNHKNPLLNKTLKEIDPIDIKELQDVAEQMYAFCEGKGGAGLSANQVGIDKRMFVLKYKEFAQTFINPTITWLSDNQTVFEEGCLTFPGVFIGVKRPDAIKITFTDYEGKLQEDQLFMGVTARIVQHEFDHMQGKFYYDNLSKLQKQRWQKKMSKKLQVVDM